MCLPLWYEYMRKDKLQLMWNTLCETHYASKLPCSCWDRIHQVKDEVPSSFGNIPWQVQNHLIFNNIPITTFLRALRYRMAQGRCPSSPRAVRPEGCWGIDRGPFYAGMPEEMLLLVLLALAPLYLIQLSKSTERPPPKSKHTTTCQTSIFPVENHCKHHLHLLNMKTFLVQSLAL